MTGVSGADACRRLGIDATPLCRWMAQAHLSRHDHPRDGRAQGISGEHREQRASLHHRPLDALPEEPSPSVPTREPSWPAHLGALPETSGTVHAQITTVPHHVAARTSLLQKPRAQPSSPQAPRTSPPAAPRPCTPPSPTPRSRPPPSAPATTPSRPAPVIPRVDDGTEGRSVGICPTRGVLPYEPETPEWGAWVATQDSCRGVGQDGHVSAHQAWRVPTGAWRAHRPIRTHHDMVRLAPTQEVTSAVVEHAAQALHAHLASLRPGFGTPCCASETGFAHHAHKDVPLE
jgi:hypothetical protein